MKPPAIASRDEWLVARKKLLLEERALTHAADVLAAKRRELPWVKLTADYQFDGPQGKRSLADLFEHRSQLLIYHFMLSPDSEHICSGCGFISDHIDSARQHFEQADLSFAAISRATITQIESVRARMNWKFPWLSSFSSSFNYDFGVSFTPEAIKSQRAEYNYAPLDSDIEDLHGVSVFARDDSGQIYHTYSCYARGAERLIGAFNFLDLVTKGRNEPDGTMCWVRLHDEYGNDKPCACSSDY